MQENKYRPSIIFQLFINSGGFIKLFLIFFVMVTCLLLFSSLSFLLAVPLFHLTSQQLAGLLNGNILELDISLLKYIQITQTIAFFVIPAILLNYLMFNPGEGFIAGGKIPSPMLISLVVITLLISSPIVSLLIEWNSSVKLPACLHGLEFKIQQWEINATKITEKLLSGTKIINYMLNLLMVAIVPAIGEEFLFRGVLQRIFIGWLKNSHVAILLAAILFSGFHMQFYGFVPRLVLGLFFGYLFYWTGNIWIAVLAHFFNNAVAVTQEFFDKKIAPDTSSVLTRFQSNIIVIALSVGLTILLVFLIQKKYKITPTR
jgi:uncharacterized protein